MAYPSPRRKRPLAAALLSAALFLLPSSLHAQSSDAAPAEQKERAEQKQSQPPFTDEITVTATR